MAWLFQYFEFVSVECIMYAQRLNEIQNECINKQMRKRAYPPGGSPAERFENRGVNSSQGKKINPNCLAPSLIFSCGLCCLMWA